MFDFSAVALRDGDEVETEKIGLAFRNQRAW